MNLITPNKEIIRRICILNGGTCCYISHTRGHAYIEVLVDIEDKKLNQFSQQLTEWTGIDYKVYNINKQDNIRTTLGHINNKILPII
jgi:hypothetical protein